VTGELQFSEQLTAAELAKKRFALGYDFGVT
jgi:hypothetical protein